MNLDTIKTRFGIVGHSPRLKNAIEIAVQVAPTEVTVLVEGENGTGKDVFSKIIHQFSKRKHEKFIAINCGAIPEGTMDSELFGHEKGSFTSAYESRKGYFEEVNGGTIFLDEIGEMPKATQSRLLRVLESGEYLRVGSSKIQHTNVRVIAATNKNLVDLIRRGKFREDLFFRLNTVSIKVPPLRERGDDIELLFRYFSGMFSDKYNRNPIMLTPAAADVLYQYRWPGNVREMRNFAEKLTVLVDDDYIDAEVIKQHLIITESNLPSVVEFMGNGDSAKVENQNTDVLFKLIFDLRQEVGEMKKLFFMGMNKKQPERNEPIYIEGEQGGTTIYKSPSYNPPSTRPENPNPPMLTESLSLEKKEKEMIIKALQKYTNNRKKAAQELGISERTLYRKIKHYDID